MRLLLLGKPYHGRILEQDTAPESLTLDYDVQPSKRTHVHTGGTAFTIPRKQRVAYVRRHDEGLPEGVAVYSRPGYEPQEEDAELVRDVFGLGGEEG